MCALYAGGSVSLTYTLLVSAMYLFALVAMAKIRTLLPTHTPHQYMLPHHMLLCTCNPYIFLWSVMGPPWRVLLGHQYMPPPGIVLSKLPPSCGSQCFSVFPCFRNIGFLLFKYEFIYGCNEVSWLVEKVPLLFCTATLIFLGNAFLLNWAPMIYIARLVFGSL